MGASSQSARAVLQAGGRGERLRAGPDSPPDSPPKPLTPVGGVPMVERLLRQFVACGFRHVTVVTGHQAERVERHLDDLSDLPEDLQLEFLRETAVRGNCGALADLPRDGRTVVMAFADLVTDLDFGELLELHGRRGCDLTLASHHESHRVRLGELVVDEHRVLDYREKPLKEFLICSGICALEPRVLELIPGGGAVGLSDVARAAIRAGLSVTHWTHGSFWIDVNSPQELDEACAAVAPIEGRS
ncbi:MAG: nucleotidyltransferase family protein [bacterium]|nr:nucleotidyltransferase family protein [bacterium]